MVHRRNYVYIEMQHMFKRNLQKEQKIIENDKLKNIFSIVFKSYCIYHSQYKMFSCGTDQCRFGTQMTLRITMANMKISNLVLAYTSFWCQNSSTVHMKNPFVSEPNNSSQAFLQPNISKWILNQELVTLNPRYYLIKKWECN